MSRYLDFVKSGAGTLIERQSARAGGRPEGALCITVTRQPSKAYRSMGGKVGDTRRSFPIEAHPVEPEPYRLDFNVWPVLDLLSDVTGDAQYRRLADGMASVFARHGFDPASGLGYVGIQADFDVIRLRPLESMPSHTKPTFKPAVNLQIDRLWEAAPEQMARMFKAAYYGLITRPENMDYNRYCSYGFDDRAKRPSMAFRSNYVAFAQTGAMLIHWWSYLFARTGDLECLGWAQAMAAKWLAVQHPETGLIPHWFGSDQDGEPAQPPRFHANNGEMLTVVSLLKGEIELRKRREGAGLADQVGGMARRLLRGMSLYGYNPKERIFPQWLHLDGREQEETVFYCFRTQAEKDEAVKKDPTLQDVAVYAGSGFYDGGPGSVSANNYFPHYVATGAQMTGSPEALAAARRYADDLMEEAGKLTGPLNAQGQWTYHASASYIKMMLILHEMTKERQYLDRARKLADMELDFLSRPVPGQPEWWRLPFRNSLLEALVLLHREMERS